MSVEMQGWSHHRDTCTFVCILRARWIKCTEQGTSSSFVLQLVPIGKTSGPAMVRLRWKNGWGPGITGARFAICLAWALQDPCPGQPFKSPKVRLGHPVQRHGPGLS